MPSPAQSGPVQSGPVQSGPAQSGPAPVLAPAKRLYEGKISRPERWATWVPLRGDILVCTPPKSGTTWTQTILAMLVHGGPDLPARLPVVSPWVDADLGVPADEVAAALVAQTGRRVVKTHAPADGFPIWDGVTVVAVYRHPLDVFFSLRKHVENYATPDKDDPNSLPVPQAIRAFIADEGDFDHDSLATLTAHYRETALSGRVPDLKLFHYSQMLLDPRGAVQALAQAAGIDADDGLIDAVTRATAFQAMKARAADFAPVGGTGFWKSDENFFESASSDKWKGRLSAEDLGLYQARLADLVPDLRARAWLESGQVGT